MSFQQGLSGLNATSKNLEVIGNNIANASTFGAKASRAEFGDMYAAALNGAGTSPIGIGVNLQAVSQQFTQGNIQTTTNQMDLAINGAGFFQLQNSLADASRSYSRNGQFKVNADGYIVNNQQQLLLAYPKPVPGQPPQGPAGPIQLETQGGDPAVTTRIELEMNLNSAAEVKDPTNAQTMDSTLASTYNNSTSVTVYDDRGQAVALQLFFQRAPSDPDGTGHWNVYALADGQPVNGGTLDALVPLSPQLVFPPDGSAPANALDPFTIPTDGNHLDIPAIQLDLAGATQYGSAFGVTNLDQDGYAKGDLTGISFSNDGTIVARYTNGETQVAGQIELSNFRNPQGLQPLGNNGWAQTAASGGPVPNVPGQGNLGILQAGALEESNIDLTGELVNMIVAQRVYQANAQTIKAQDAVLQTLVNIR